MGIAESQFDSEQELEDWVFAQLPIFLGDCVTLGKFQIVTPTGKRSVPDGFAFNFWNREWFLIEAELLRHGVWPHIAEQITRFVVSLQSPDTLRKIRDNLFEEIVQSNRTAEVAQCLDVGPERLLQQIELFVESVRPSVTIFIDESSQDLQDFANAIDVPVRIYRVKKFLVNGNREYYSPDVAEPVVETSPQESGLASTEDLEVISALGGGSFCASERRFKCYRLDDGRIVHIKRSRFYDRQQYYWYGITETSLELAARFGVTHFAFVTGNWGVGLLEIDKVVEFCGSANPTRNQDGTVRHYHAFISQEPELEFYGGQDAPRYPLADNLVEFE